MVEWKRQAVDLRVDAVHEIVHGEAVGFVHGLGARDRLQHGADDDIGANNGEIEDGVL